MAGLPHWIHIIEFRESNIMKHFLCCFFVSERTSGGERQRSEEDADSQILSNSIMYAKVIHLWPISLSSFPGLKLSSFTTPCHCPASLTEKLNLGEGNDALPGFSCLLGA